MIKKNNLGGAPSRHSLNLRFEGAEMDGVSIPPSPYASGPLVVPFVKGNPKVAVRVPRCDGEIASVSNNPDLSQINNSVVARDAVNVVNLTLRLPSIMDNPCDRVSHEEHMIDLACQMPAMLRRREGGFAGIFGVPCCADRFRASIMSRLHLGVREHLWPTRLP